MACLSRGIESKLKAKLQGARVRLCFRQAREEFEGAVKEVEGGEALIIWNAHNIPLTVMVPEPIPASQQAERKSPVPAGELSKKEQPTIRPEQTSKEARLRELRLKREMYSNQLKIVEEKIRERERRKSPFLV